MYKWLIYSYIVTVLEFDWLSAVPKVIYSLKNKVNLNPSLHSGGEFFN